MPHWEEVNTCLMPVDTSPVFFFFLIGEKGLLQGHERRQVPVHSCLKKLQIPLKGFGKAFLKGR